ncbi:histidine kinase [Streptomyces sp. NBC_01006]|uniref:sensor histidine kinase n=1 Tax=Streptomyces sp. NBC_01006 TaxID=2903716 RepID=UPI002F90B9EA|nr:histidine kinase [Streptomyces sp. NBC_01006]
MTSPAEVTPSPGAATAEPAEAPEALVSARYQTDVRRATTHTRWMLCLMPWLLLASLLWPLLAHLDAADAMDTANAMDAADATRLPAGIGWMVAGVTALQGLGATTAIAYRLGRAKRSAGLIAAMAAVTVLELSLLPWAYDTGLIDHSRGLILAAITVAIPPAFALALVLAQVPYLAVALAQSLAAGALALAADRAAAPAVLAFTVTTWVVIGTLMRSSVWFLAVLWQLNAAREAQTRLVVAEERLRFARDLHDVIGRNLSVIALKAELAERLAENPRAQSEMAQVQSLTRGLHHEIREVVNGYRSTDLATELQGAQAILEAAGIACRIRRTTGSDLSHEAQTALGWVVREGVTNVLRHSHAGTCTISLSDTGDGRTRLDLVNDGAGQAAAPAAQAVPPPGNGLAGLVERLAPLGGTLRHGPSAAHTYRLTVHLPTGSSR